MAKEFDIPARDYLRFIEGEIDRLKGEREEEVGTGLAKRGLLGSGAGESILQEQLEPFATAKIGEAAKLGLSEYQRRVGEGFQERTASTAYGRQQFMQQLGFGQQTRMQEAGFGQQLKVLGQQQKFASGEAEEAREFEERLKKEMFELQATLQQQIAEEQRKASTLGGIFGGVGSVLGGIFS